MLHEIYIFSEQVSVHASSFWNIFGDKDLQINKFSKETSILN